MCNRSPRSAQVPLSASAQAACRRNRQQALRNRALYEAGALPGLRPNSTACPGARAAASAAGSCGSSSPTLTSELYGGAAVQVETATCCDATCGCRSFDSARRNRYWPRFCHPRWLSCNELYNCRLP